MTQFFFADLISPPRPDLLAAQTQGDRALALGLLDQYIAAHDQGSAEAEWQQAIYGLAARHGIKPGALFMLLRLALTGSDRTPPLFPIVTLLGEVEVRRRLVVARTLLTVS